MNEIAFVVPGRLDQLTGGYLFDRRIVEGLRARGRVVRVIELSARGRNAGSAELAALPNGTRTVVDGLALSGLAEWVMAQARRLRLVAFVHGPLALETSLAPDAAKRAAAREAELLSRVRGVLCPSRTTAVAIEGYGIPRERIAVVPPGTAKPACQPALRRGRVRTLLCVANLVPRKGHELLIDALARIRDLDWNVVCVGSLERDPTTVRLVRRKVRATGLGRRIILAGECPPQRVALAYRRADAFVLPSLHEGYGMVYAEAMVHGLPVIATTAGAIPETVPARAGLLVPPGDCSALARALRRVIAQPTLSARLAAAARIHGARLPDWPHATAAWERSFDRLAALEAPP
jgi:glycosyltransferase involved in cell wall biosynthesis